MLIKSASPTLPLQTSILKRMVIRKAQAKQAKKNNKAPCNKHSLTQNRQTSKGATTGEQKGLVAPPPNAVLASFPIRLNPQSVFSSVYRRMLPLLRPFRIFFYLLQNKRLPKKIKNTKFEKKLRFGSRTETFFTQDLVFALFCAASWCYVKFLLLMSHCKIEN